MTDDNDFDDDKTPLDKALDAVEDLDDDKDLDQYLKRALRHINIGVKEIQTVLKKRGALPFGKH